MEFWGVEVKPGEPLKIKLEFPKLIHISQAALGEVKIGKGPDHARVRLKIDDKIYVLGTLSVEDRPQLMFNLVLHKEFELSHDWKDGSIYFAGYTGQEESGGQRVSDVEGSLDEDEDNKVVTPESGKVEPVKLATKAVAVKSKPSDKIVSENDILKKGNTISTEDDDDSDDDDDDEDDSDDDVDEYLMSNEAKPAKKRPSEAAAEPLLPAAKKAKSAAPGKSGGKNTPN